MKLYWRVKKDGKWTWKPAKIREDGNYRHGGTNYLSVEDLR